LRSSFEWGLFRRYWVLVKLLMEVPAIVLMLIHTQLVGYIAGVTISTTFSSGELAGPRIQLVVFACAALLVLLIGTALSTYKPRGRTPYEMHRLERRSSSQHYLEFEPVGAGAIVEGERQ